MYVPKSAQYLFCKQAAAVKRHQTLKATGFAQLPVLPFKGSVANSSPARTAAGEMSRYRATCALLLCVCVRLVVPCIGTSPSTACFTRQAFRLQCPRRWQQTHLWRGRRDYERPQKSVRGAPSHRSEAAFSPSSVSDAAKSPAASMSSIPLGRWCVA